jgi:O-antigen ligase
MYTGLPNMCVGVWEYVTGNIFAFDPDEVEMTSVASARITGTVIDANDYGIYSSFLLFAALPLFLRNKSKESMIFIGLIAFSLFASQNRGTWISIFVALFVTVAVFRKHLRVFYWAATAAVTTLVSFPFVLKRFGELNQYDEFGQLQDTFSGRLNYHAELLNRSLEHPLLGTGQGTSAWTEISPGVIDTVWPHNDYMRIVVDSGYISLILYIVFFFAQLIRSWQLRNSLRWDIQFSAHATQIYVIIISLMQNLYLDLLVYPVLMYLLAVFHRAAALDKVQQQFVANSAAGADQRGYADAR